MNKETPAAAPGTVQVVPASAGAAALPAAAVGGVPSAGASDEALMCAYRDGEAAAFDVLYERHRGPVYRYFRRQLQTPDAAEELFQDVWMRVIDARRGYQPQAKFTTWLYTIAHNRLMDFYRARQRTPAESIDADESLLNELAVADHELPEAIFQRREAGAHLLRALATLPAAQREAFLLHAESGLTLE